MNEGHAEDSLRFSEMSNEELLEVVNSSSGGYRQEVVDGARGELKKRAGGAEGETEGPRFEDAPAGGSRAPAGEAHAPLVPALIPAGRLFSIGQVTLAAFLGSVVAGSLLMAHNYRVLGRRGLAWQHLAGGVVVTLLIVVVAFFLPEGAPGLGIPVSLGAYIYAQQLQGEAIGNHFRAGGRGVSWWAAAAMGLACSVALIVLVFIALIALDPALPLPEERPVHIAKVRVSHAGEVEMNGVRLNHEEFRSALEKLKDRGGAVWYYRERSSEPASEEVLKVVRIVGEAGVPVRMSSRPDFSDYIDEKGNSVPSTGAGARPEYFTPPARSSPRP